MRGVAVDASVWIAAQDTADPFCSRSRSFFTHLVANGIVIQVPAFARLEVACALARKLRNSVQGERLANLLFKTAGAKEHPVDSMLLAKSLTLGTTMFLRGADTMCSATAEMIGCTLTPDDWLVANPLP